MQLNLDLEVNRFGGGAFNPSPARGKEPEGLAPEEIAHHYYEHRAKTATEELMRFLSDVFPEKRMTVMYFDEAQELGSLYWVILRIVAQQPSFIKMWYTFLGTKSRITDYAPPPSESQSVASLRLLAHV